MKQKPSFLQRARCTGTIKTLINMKEQVSAIAPPATVSIGIRRLGCLDIMTLQFMRQPIC